MARGFTLRLCAARSQRNVLTRSLKRPRAKGRGRSRPERAPSRGPAASRMVCLTPEGPAMAPLNLSQRNERRRRLSDKHFFFKLFTYNRKFAIVTLSLDERRSQGARRKAAASASCGQNEGISFEGRGRERLLGMKGWRPSAILKARNRIGPFEAGVFLPDIGSIGLSLFAGPGLGAHAPRMGSADVRVPFSRSSGSARPAGRTQTAQASPRDAIRDRNGASPSLA
jgi:hypothetical protein